MKGRSRIWVILFIILGLLYIVIDSYEGPDWISKVLTSLVTVTGVFALWYQLKKEKDISEGQFILDLNKTFLQDAGIKHIYNQLKNNINNEKGHYLEDKDRPFIADYLIFFETLYIFYAKGIFKMSEIDDMFAYRFFIAVNNEEMRRIELDENGDFFRPLYDLYVPWAAFRRSKNREILHEHLDFQTYYEKNHIPALIAEYPKADYTIKHYNILKDKDVWDSVDSLLRECDDEFVPALSSRGYHGEILPEKKQDTTNFSYMRELRDQHILTIETADGICGFLSFYHKYPDDEFKTIGLSNYIMTICVTHSERRKGFGHALYDFLLNHLDERYRMRYVSTRTWSTNESHIHLLKKLGFQEDHIEVNARGNNIDTIYYFYEQNE